MRYIHILIEHKMKKHQQETAFPPPRVFASDRIKFRDKKSGGSTPCARIEVAHVLKRTKEQRTRPLENKVLSRRKQNENKQFQVFKGSVFLQL